MITASISQTKNQLSALIDKVRHGEAVLIMDRDRPVARLEPVTGGDHADQAAILAQLERSGIIRRATRTLDEQFFAVPPPQGEGRDSLLRALLSDREQGR